MSYGDTASQIQARIDLEAASSYAANLLDKVGTFILYRGNVLVEWATRQFESPQQCVANVSSQLRQRLDEITKFKDNLRTSIQMLQYNESTRVKVSQS